jgi:peptidoglycan/xylan/chitin deacetylase (PgdA/CDA1 family)
MPRLAHLHAVRASVKVKRPFLFRNSCTDFVSAVGARCRLAAAMALGLLFLCTDSKGAEPVPDKLVVLTFDDSVASQATFVAPLLKRLGFGATFFITEGFNFLTDKEHYMTWDQIRELHGQGFEIGNHTRSHRGVANLDPENFAAEITHIEERCREQAIPKPVTFCYPGYGASPTAAQFLRNRGYLFARAGGNRAFNPLKDDPLLLPQAFDGKPGSTLDSFKEAVEKARNGEIAILTFHGVPDIQHPWVSTEPAKFESYMQHLKDTGCKVISLGELGRYVPAVQGTAKPNQTTTAP